MIKFKEAIAIGLIGTSMLSMTAYGAEAAKEDTRSELETEKKDDMYQGNSKNLGIEMEKMLTELEESYNSLHETIVDYNSYGEHKSEINRFYSELVTKTEEEFDYLNNASLEYFKYIFTEYADDDKALDRAIDDYYDDVYSGILDDYYKDVYSGIMDDMYDDYYSGIIDDAYDQVEYKEWSAASTDAYQMWSSTSSEVYNLWSDESSLCYRMWSEASSQYWKKNKDVDAVMDSISEAKGKKDESSEGKEQETNDKDEEKETVDAVETEDGVNPEIKKALDAYEEFFDEYVDFMKKYQKASTEDMAAMMGDYTDYMLQYMDMMQKMQKMQSADLSTQDLAYYIEVTARIEKKLLSITE